MTLSLSLGGAAALDPTRPLSEATEKECKALELSTFADAPSPADAGAATTSAASEGGGAAGGGSTKSAPGEGGGAAADAAAAAAPAAVAHTAFGSQLRFWYNVTNVAEVLRNDISEETVAKKNPKCKNKKAQVKAERKVMMPTLITPEKLPIEPLGTCFYPVTSLSYVVLRCARLRPIV